MVVIVQERVPTGTGVSLSGAKAFYINARNAPDWEAVERHPEFKHLPPEEQAEIRSQFPASMFRYREIYSTRFY